jgi:hypothetical protein
MRGARWKQSDRPSITSIPSLCRMTAAKNQLALTQIQGASCCSPNFEPHADYGFLGFPVTGFQNCP